MTRAVKWAEQAWDEFRAFEKDNPKVAKRIVALLKDTLEHPFEGIGKPEPLKYNLKGYWSRRITNEHRMVYKVTQDEILIAQVMYHY